MSTLQSSPPILQFICRAILVAMAMTVCCLPRVRATTHWLGVGQSVHKYFLMASYLSLRLLDNRQTTYKQRDGLIISGQEPGGQSWAEAGQQAHRKAVKATCTSSAGRLLGSSSAGQHSVQACTAQPGQGGCRHRADRVAVAGRAHTHTEPGPLHDQPGRTWDRASWRGRQADPA